MNELRTELINAATQELAAEGVEVISTLQDVKKVNNTGYTALNVRPEGKPIGVSINLQEIDEKIAELVTDFSKTIKNAIKNIPDISIPATYEELKEGLMVEAVGKIANEEMLSDIPHKIIADIAIVIRYIVNSDEKGTTSFLVTKDTLKFYKVDTDTLYADAISNSITKHPLRIRGMFDVLSALMDGEEDLLMDESIQDVGDFPIVCSNEAGIKGAGVIAYPDFYEKALAATKGIDFYILPSSIHEVLLMPKNDMPPEDIKNTVLMVNEACVSAAEKLSDNIYEYVDGELKVVQV